MIELKNFTDLTHEEALLILAWRNNENIRKWMYTSSEISPREHQLFLKSLQSTKTKRYFWVSNAKKLIGVIYFTDITHEDCCMGLYVNPSLSEKGLGTLLMQTIVEYAFKTLKVQTLKAEVFTHNEKAFRLYEKFGFYETTRTHVNDKEVIFMELNNENR